MNGKLLLENGNEYEGVSFGAKQATSGEVVFSTGMMGYPESLTDPSYKGQILILTYPLIGNYGVPDKELWESDTIMVEGLIVSDYIDTPSHFQSRRTLAQWFRDENLPLLQIKDTRLLTQIIRDKGAMLGKIIFDEDIAQYDPNTENLVAKVSLKTPTLMGQDNKNGKIILLIDCGAKRNIQKALVKRGHVVVTVPWDFDPTSGENKRTISELLTKHAIKSDVPYHGIVISNGPGDPKFADRTIRNARRVMEAKIPLLGICLGHQILSLAAGGDTAKLKFGHRSQNQPCIMEGSDRCYITTQNHGFAVSKIPEGFRAWFTNANDGSNEGIIHENLPFMSAQFHPEATPGPEDAEWIFDHFIKTLQ